MKGEARSKRYGYLYRQQPRILTVTHYPDSRQNNFTRKHTKQYWFGINGKKFKSRKDCLRYGYR